MTVTIRPSILKGTVEAPPSKSMAHRYLIGAALSGKVCSLWGVDYSQDILATIDCLTALGAHISIDGDKVTVDPTNFMKAENPALRCRESGSTLRFFIPIALCLGKKVTLYGSNRLMERPQDVYETLCSENGFELIRTNESITLCGKLQSGSYSLRGDISSQFITGLVFALVYLGGDSVVKIIPPFESRSYVNLTIEALQSFGADVKFTDEYTIDIKGAQLREYSGRIEGDYSNGAFLDAFNHIGSQVVVNNLKNNSLQGDSVYKDYFAQLSAGTPTLDISDCPDLGPILFALAAMKNGAVFTGTDRLKAKESDRGMAMHEELQKLGGGLVFGDNTITVPKQNLHSTDAVIDGHNDHRIVMAVSVVLTQLGGTIEGAQAVSKSYPSFFEDIRKLGAEVEIKH